MVLRCETCEGRKKVLGLGGLIKTCEACAGTGWQVGGLCAPSVHVDKRSKAYRESKKQQEA